MNNEFSNIKSAYRNLIMKLPKYIEGNKKNEINELIENILNLLNNHISKTNN